jgi:hypothetical protein
MIFLLISVEDMTRGMYIYTTLAHAVKEGTGYEHYELRVAKVERAYSGPEGRTK